MKKTLIALALVAVSFLAGSCSTMGRDSTLNEFLIQNSIRLTGIMGDFAQSDEFVGLFIGDGHVQELVREIGRHEYALPNVAVIIRVPETVINSAMANMTSGISLSDDAREVFVTRTVLSVANTINAMQGVSVLAATNILGVNKAFLSHENFTGTAYVLLIYDNNKSIAAFRKSSEGIVNANSSFVFLSEEIEALLAERNGAALVSFIHHALGVSGAGIEIEFIDIN